MTPLTPTEVALGQVRANFVTQITEDHVGVLRTIVRIELRRNAKKRVRLIETFGEEADVLHNVEKQELLRDLYRIFGGDPENITNVREEPDLDEEDGPS